MLGFISGIGLHALRSSHSAKIATHSVEATSANLGVIRQSLPALSVKIRE
jgi:hypothetical protein